MKVEIYNKLAELGVATVYEASGRQGLVDVPLHQITPGSRVAGPARTVLCTQNDNLMVHAAMAVAQPGEVLVITMPKTAPIGLVGELLATQALKRGVAAMLIDAAVRDVEELSKIGVPIWSRFVRARGADRKGLGQLGVPVSIGGATIQSGDLVVMDADGAVAVTAEHGKKVLEAAQARAEREAGLREKFVQGTLSIDLYGLRGILGAALSNQP